MTRRGPSRLRLLLAQRRHHPAFRIPPPGAAEEQHDTLVRLLAALAAAPPTAGTTPAVPAPGPDGRAPDGRAPDGRALDGLAPDGRALDERALAGAVTNLWRGRRKLDAVPRAEQDRVARGTVQYLRRSEDMLDRAGIRVVGHDGEPFDPGQSLEEVAFEPDPALAADVVLETVQPTVHLGDRRIQMGQVVVTGPPRHQYVRE